MLEKEIQKACLQYLHYLGKKVRGIRFNQVGIYRGHSNGKAQFSFAGEEGISDIVGWLTQEAQVLIDGKPQIEKFAVFCALEIKRPKQDGGKEPTNAQRAFLKEVNDAGGIGLVIHSVDELKEQLDQYL